MAFPRRAFLAACVSLTFASLAHAQNYPSGPIKLIVPFPPAGGTDVLSRVTSQPVAEITKWNFVVENHPGAGGNIGLDMVAKAKPDGLTVGMAQTSNLAINPTLYPHMPYNALKDFTPIAAVASQPMVLVVGVNSPYKTLADLVKAARAKPGGLTMASAGTGTVGHLGGVLFGNRAGVKFLHVPYKGASAALTDVASGEVVMDFATPPSAMPLLQGKKLRAIAVTSAQRLPVLPDVPTISESGYKDFVAEDWKGYVGPAGMPAEAVKRFNAAVNEALKRPEVQKRLNDEGSKPIGGTPEEFAALIKKDNPRWGEAVRTSGAKVE
ncbi:MAG TPA: tripartite tricarboxylate transporter substrate binding protein [Burkholderiales bacterium]